MTLVRVPRLLDGGRSGHHLVAMRHGKPLTLAQLRAEAGWLCGEIRARRAARALLVCSDSFAFLAGMLGLLAARVEIVLPPNARPGTVAALAGAYDIVVSDDVAGPGVLRLDGRGSDQSPPAFDAADARIDFFTSGSAGQSKRIAKTLAMLETEAATLHALWGARVGSAATIGTVTHQHIYGLMFRVMWPLLSGRAFAAPVYDTWESLMADLTPGAAIVSSPAHLSRLAGLPVLSAHMRPALVITAGGPLPPGGAAGAREIFGIAPSEIFGSTETGALACREDGEQLWRPLPGIDVSITESGLLRVRSPYASGGTCELADKATVQSDGRFQFDGRADRIVKIEGRRVSLPELERSIKALRWVADAAIAPIPPDGLSLGAVVVLTADGAAALARDGKFRFERLLRRELAQTHEPATLPRRWRFVAAIPADSMGKRRQRDLARLFVAETSA